MTIKELCAKSQITEQTFYRLKKKDEAFTKLLEQHSNVGSNKTRNYDDAVLEYVLTRYNRDSVPDETEKASENKQSLPLETADPEIERLTKEIDELKQKLTESEAERQKLSDQIAAGEAEHQELIKQNSMLLLLLSQEKAEKQALLSAPRKTMRQKLAEIFGHNSNEQK